MPLAIAGALQDPPVSSHSAQGANLAATDAADPALLPVCKHHNVWLVFGVSAGLCHSECGNLRMCRQCFLLLLAIVHAVLVVTQLNG